MDIRRFEWACDVISQQGRERTSIGTLSEKSLHAAIKLYFEPHGDCQEISIGGYVADIVGENGIIEIQTRNFSNMKKKLSCFLLAVPVTIVHPVIVNKTVVCMDESTGEITSKRKSPKHGDIYSALEELWGIREFLNDEKLTICLLMIDAREYRIYGRDVPKYGRKKQRSPKGYFKSDRIPTKLHDEIYIKGREGYSVFIPDGLPEQFTVKDFAACAGIDEYKARWAAHLFREIGVLEKVGKRGKAYLYERRI